MKESSIFNIPLNAIGVNNNDWVKVNHYAIKEVVAGLMKANAFDIVPIVDANEECEFCWKTVTEGDYSSIEKYKIGSADIIYHKTELKDYLKKMHRENRSWYFLGDHNKINGLISACNLNSRFLRVYVYQMICELEMNLGHYFKSQLDQSAIIEQLSKLAEESENGSAQDVLDRYNAAKEKGLDNHIVEYLYLLQFYKLIVKLNLKEQIGYTSGKKIKRDFGFINEFRNWSAHPLKTDIKVSLQTGLWELSNLVGSLRLTFQKF